MYWARVRSTGPRLHRLCLPASQRVHSRLHLRLYLLCYSNTWPWESSFWPTDFQLFNRSSFDRKRVTPLLCSKIGRKNRRIWIPSAIRTTRGNEIYPWFDLQRIRDAWSEIECKFPIILSIVSRLVSFLPTYCANDIMKTIDMSYLLVYVFLLF